MITSPAANDRVTKAAAWSINSPEWSQREYWGTAAEAGTPYRADDPELLMWVLFSLVDSGLVVYRTYVGSLTREEEAAYWDDYKEVVHQQSRSFVGKWNTGAPLPGA